MTRVRVHSSWVRSVGYDKPSRTLEIEYRKEGIFQYFEVPEFLFEELLHADSKGEFVSRNIIAKYRVLDMNPPPEPEEQ